MKKLDGFTCFNLIIIFIVCNYLLFVQNTLNKRVDRLEKNLLELVTILTKKLEK